MHSYLDKNLKKHGYFRKRTNDPKAGKMLCKGLLAWNSYIHGDVKINKINLLKYVINNYMYLQYLKIFHQDYFEWYNVFIYY